MSIPHGRRAESFADDLNTRRGIVSGRVALLPRSTEIQPHVARIRPSPTRPTGRRSPLLGPRLGVLPTSEPAEPTGGQAGTGAGRTRYIKFLHVHIRFLRNGSKGSNKGGMGAQASKDIQTCAMDPTIVCIEEDWPKHTDMHHGWTDGWMFRHPNGVVKHQGWVPRRPRMDVYQCPGVQGWTVKHQGWVYSNA